jgi:hypothetical protein
MKHPAQVFCYGITIQTEVTVIIILAIVLVEEMIVKFGISMKRTMPSVLVAFSYLILKENN